MREIAVTWASEIQMCNPPTCDACGKVMWWHGSTRGFGCPPLTLGSRAAND